MVYESEISIYKDGALKSKFSSIQTQFDVTLGKISAIISESEIEEYLNGHTTMNSKLSSVVQDVDGVHTQVSGMQTNYDGQFTTVNSHLTQLDTSISGITASVSSVQDDVDGLGDRVSAAELKITDSAIISTVTDTSDGRTRLNSIIDQQVNSITLSVSSLEDRVSSAETKITDSAIISTVTGTTDGKTALNSVIDQRADSIRLKADKISWSSTYSSMTENGTLTASNVELTGKITATSGYIGTSSSGFAISSSAIYNGISSVSATSGTGVYVGTNGINLGGGKFKVTSAGALQWTATNSTMASDGALTVKSLTADSYIYVDGNKNSFFRLPLYPWNSTSSSNATYFQISNDGMFIKVWANEFNEGSAGMEYTTAEFGNSSVTQRKRAITLTCSSFSVESGIGAGLITFTDSSNSTTFYSSLTAKGLSSSSSGDSPVSSYYLYDACYINGSLKVTGTKNRIISTDDYSDRLLYCYETPSPLFGDVGEGEIGEDGKCYVWLDPIFAQTVRTANYQVSLQSYSPSFAYVIERTDAYFIVGGEPGAKFGWEIKAKQADFAENRLDRFVEQREDDSVNYGLLAKNHIQELMEGRYAE